MRGHLLCEVEAWQEGKGDVQEVTHRYLPREVLQAWNVFEACCDAGVSAKRFRSRKPEAKATHIEKVLEATKIPEAKEREHSGTPSVDGLGTLKITLRHDIRGGCLHCGGAQR